MDSLESKINLLNDYISIGIINKDNIQNVLEEVFESCITINYNCVQIFSFDFTDCKFSIEKDSFTDNEILNIVLKDDIKIYLIKKILSGYRRFTNLSGINVNNTVFDSIFYPYTFIDTPTPF